MPSLNLFMGLVWEHISQHNTHIHKHLFTKVTGETQNSFSCLRVTLSWSCNLFWKKITYGQLEGFELCLHRTVHMLKCCVLRHRDGLSSIIIIHSQ